MQLIDLKPLMTLGMFAELHRLSTLEVELTVERVRCGAQGYRPNGEYMGICAPGERIHRIDTEYGVTYIRSRATATQIRNALAGELRIRAERYAIK